MDTGRRIDFSSIGLLILRLGIGGYMLTHGWRKFLNLIAWDIPQQFDPIGLGPTPSYLLIVFAEFLCALLVMAGLATRLAAIPLVVAMGVAAFVAHGADPWTMAAATNGSKQPALMFLSVFLALVFTGAGGYSLDAQVVPRIKRRKRYG